jgi:transcription antitermination factor NusG
MIWIGYARSGCEAQVVEDIKAMGIDARVPLKIEAIRRGKQRWAEAVTTSIFPNYVFINCTDTEWHLLKGVKNLAATFYPAPVRIYEREILPLIDHAEKEYAERKAAIEAGERVSEYRDGDKLILLAGKLAGTIATFRRLVEAGEYGFPEIVAELPASIGGKPMMIRIDPLEAKGVA